MLAVIVLSTVVSVQAADPSARLTYNQDIRPILAENCFACHGPDSAGRKGDLRLDRFNDAVEAGAIIPGKPSESELVARILTKDEGDLMPPPESHKKLTEAQKQTLIRWIEQGGEYQPHWSFIAPTRPELPRVKNAAWVRNPIDRFILARLESMGLQPAPEADRPTLARRVALDLTGLPPTPEQVAAFVNDTSPDAYEKYVDRLMALPSWGEHRGRYWLDAARYADTHGLHFDNFREMWTYRDWVIKAFNANMPFDQFTVEQLAGDLLPDPTTEQLVATGFNRCLMTTNEGGVIQEEVLVAYTNDRTETTSAVFMALTAQCAICHDHKLDPMTQREYFELAAFFNNTTQPAMDGNKPRTNPIIPIVGPDDEPRHVQITAELKTSREKLKQLDGPSRKAFAQWVKSVNPAKFQEPLPTEGLRLLAPLDEAQGNNLAAKWDGRAAAFTAAGRAPVIQDGALVNAPGLTVESASIGQLDAGKPFSFGTFVKFEKLPSAGAIFARMDDPQTYRGWDLWIENGTVGAHLIDTWDANGLKVMSEEPIKANTWTHVFVTYDGSRKAAGVKVFIDGKEQKASVHNDRLKPDASFATDVPLKIGQRNKASRLDNMAIRDMRIYDRELSKHEVAALSQNGRIASLLAKTKRSNKENDELLAWYRQNIDTQWRDTQAMVDKLDSERKDLENRGTVAYVMQEKNEPAKAYVLFRGEYDKRREEVSPSTPEMLPPMSPDLPRNRLGFAKWLLTPEHPLMTRVTVNRFWQEVFGQGIVRTTGDFGIAGELPSHPELLDYLAVDFREGGWDVKRLFKLMVTSATYRQSAATTAQKLEVDPSNRLLARGPRFRMDAEMVRDYALASSGLLSPKIGGPSVKPYQPPGVWEAVAMNVSNTREYKQDSGESLYRRSMYTFWKRAAPPASMEIFNAPSRETCTVRRDRTNTPLQALAALNDPQLVEAARNLAQLTLQKAGPTLDARVTFMVNRIALRSPTPDERAVINTSLQDLLSHYRQTPADAVALLAVGESKPDPSLDAAELAGWTMLANQLMNLDEVLNK
jgi:cytochrome c553